MAKLPESVEAFLKGKRLVVAGVSRDGKQAAVDIFHRGMCWWLGRTGRVPARS